jgi:hypothetical protein
MAVRAAARAAAPAAEEPSMDFSAPGAIVSRSRRRGSPVKGLLIGAGITAVVAAVAAVVVVKALDKGDDAGSSAKHTGTGKAVALANKSTNDSDRSRGRGTRLDKAKAGSGGRVPQDSSGRRRKKDKGLAFSGIGEDGKAEGPGGNPELDKTTGEKRNTGRGVTQGIPDPGGDEPGAKQPKQPPKDKANGIEPDDKNAGRPVRNPGTTAVALQLETLDFPEGNFTYKVRRLKLPPDRPKRLRVAVTPKQCDDMGSLLKKLGLPYTEIKDAELQNLERLQEFDVVFMTCNIDPPRGVNATARALRQFVELGGTLYSSDWRLNLVTAAFPDYADPDLYNTGLAPQMVEAAIKSLDLQRHLGLKAGRLPLHFEMDAWHPAAFNKDKTVTLLEGDYRTTTNNVQHASLLTKFRHGAGMVIFTSFHNAKQQSVYENKLLKYLVFTVVNAKAESTVTDLMVQAGFSPQRLQSTQLGKGKTTPAQTYRHEKKGGFQVGVGFIDAGARLKVTLTGPDGKKIEHEDAGTFLVEVRDAPAGEWRYSVSAVDVPFNNFPLVTAVGKTN